ncbi:MAG TPA: class I SAM-dependent methyltransferase [Casimicrobiaceae bacterium]|jgi:ubiquinone/menaquinone biosynthesis C-methylase UbiE
MARENYAAPAYDSIAHLYDVDMAQNMRFDDVGFYRRVCAAHGGRVLELGCGNGRILLELHANGIEIVGIDRSQKMLAELLRKAEARGLPVRASVMDVRLLGFGRHFDVVLCPYSLITYMTAEDDANQMLAEVKRVLAPGGMVVIDAFISRPVEPVRDFTRDYVRPFGAHSLMRSKRITAVSDRVNRVERRYEIVSSDGVVQQRIETCEDIRAYTPFQLTTLLATCGLRTREAWWNYASKIELTDAQFFTAVAERS